MDSKPQSPVFIVGSPRSGTTWLYHLLLASGGFAIYRTESQMYDRLGPGFGGFETEQDRSEFLDTWIPSEYFIRSGLVAQEFRDQALANAGSPGDMLRLLMDGICQRQEAKRWADCTPAHGLYLRTIKRDFPNALFIHLIRDGRDVALSLAKQNFVSSLPWHGSKPYLAAAAYWAWIVKQTRQGAESLGSDVMEIRYEELVLDLDRALQRVSEFIGKRIDLSRIERFSIGSIKKPNSSFGEVTSASQTSNLTRWLSAMSREELRALESMIHGELLELGYPLTSSDSERASAAMRLSKATYEIKYSLSRSANRLRWNSDRSLASAGQMTPDADPTLRPADNLSTIREIVG